MRWHQPRWTDARAEGKERPVSAPRERERQPIDADSRRSKARSVKRWMAAAGVILLLGAMAVGYAEWRDRNRMRSGAIGIHDARHLREILDAAVIYAQDRDEIGPPDITTLIDEGLLEPRYLESAEYKEMTDGGGNYFLRPNAVLDFNSERVVGYSRTGYVSGKGVNVAFASGHVMLMRHDRFRDLLEQDPQQGGDWNLPSRSLYR